MSRPSALPSPLTRARRPAPTAPPAGPESTLQAPDAGRLLGRGDTAGGVHHLRRAGGRLVGRGLAELAQVAAK